MKRFKINIKRVILVLIAPLLMICGVMAQGEGYQKSLAHIIAMNRNESFNALNAYLNLNCKTDKKTYKKVFSVFEEMLSEPTWDYHNEELYKILIEHASTATCLSDNEKMRAQLLLDVVNKNAPGQVANDIDYETTDGSRHHLSEINTPYTLIYFNDPECFSCFKVKERLDTCTTLKNLVCDSTLTVIGIYPYNNLEEWKLEPMPEYLINGWDYEQKIEGEQTYDLMTMPLFYLFDKEKRVILKNEASLNRVLRVLTHLKGIEYNDIEKSLDVAWTWGMSPNFLKLVREDD